MKKILLPVIIVTIVLFNSISYADDNIREPVVIVPKPNISQENSIDLESFARNDGATNITSVGKGAIKTDLTPQAIEQLKQTNQYKVLQETHKVTFN